MLDLQMYINGEWRQPDSANINEVINPATQEVIAKAPRATKEETEETIQIAKHAFESGCWSEMTARERSEFLFKIADKIEERHAEIVEAEVINNGKTKNEVAYDISDAAYCFRYYGGLITAPEGHTYQVPDEMQSMTVKEPAGVAGLIVPWNLPFLMGAWKIAPALAAGNTIVFKPAELTPITAMKLFEIMDEAGIPAGVVNMLMGKGSVVGQTVAESHKVDVVSFTGSTDVGRRIMQAASGNLKKVSLELGGKSPNIIFDDAALETAVDYALFGIFFGSGQNCSAGSRILVQDGIYDRFVERFIERAGKIKVGPGLDENAEMGAITSQNQLESILEYIDIGQKEGATLALGGRQLTENELDKGFFVEPTVFTDVTSDMRIVQEEIFGPVVTIQKFQSEQEAIQLANDTDYGLAGAVFSQDAAKAMRVIKKVRAGITWINTYHPTFVEAPWGGYKQSGIGRSLGTSGLEEFQEVKQINMNQSLELSGWFSE